MSKNILAITSVVGLIILVSMARVMGVEKGTPLFQVIGGILIAAALGLLFFGKKKNKN